MRSIKTSNIKGVGNSPIISLNHYHNQLLEFKEFSQIKEEFFNRVGYSEIYEIADFLRTAKTANASRFSEENLIKLFTRINELTDPVRSGGNVVVEEVKTILDVLGSLKYKKYQLQELRIGNLVGVFNRQENLGSRSISRFLKSCSSLSYDKNELEIDGEKLNGKVNLQFANFSLDEKIGLLNSMARFEYGFGEEELPPVLEESRKMYWKEFLIAVPINYLVI